MAENESISTTSAVNESEGGIRKELGLFGVFSISAGAMISSGLFVLPGLAFKLAGPASILSYGLASLLVIPVLLSQSELSTAMPKAGGSYFYIERSLGPLMGTIAGFSNWLSIAFKSIFALVGIGALGALVFFDEKEWGLYGILLSIGACVCFTILNLVSTKETGRLQNLLVVGLILIVGFYLFSGMPHVEEKRFINFMQKGWASVFAVAGMVFVSFGGLTKVASVAEEVRNPTRNLPLGMITAFFLVSALYILAVFTTVGLVDAEVLGAPSYTPIADGASSVVGGWGMKIISFAALLAFATTANSGILAASRSPMAMSRDGLLPEFMSRCSKRFNTPITSIFITSVFMILVIATLGLETLVKTASTMMILMFMLTNLSVIILRESGVQNYQPTFKAPLYPWLQIVAIVLYGFLIVEMGRMPLILTAVFIVLAVFWYFGYVHTRIDRQSALLYLVKRILSRHIGRARLDEELVQILLERDEVSFDRFDHLVKDCPIIDIEKSINGKDMFKQVADALSLRLKTTSEHLYELFLERERESSTVIQPGLAIPHIIVPGEQVFELALVRCKEGVVFSELNAPVNTAFILAGSPDERNYHLRALMSIANIVQENGFLEKWLAAGSAEQLRDLVLLSSRERDRR